MHVAAAPDAAWEAVRTTDLLRSRTIRLLFALRGLGGALTRRAPLGPVTLDDLTRVGFVLLEERPPQEVVLGIAGRFWTPSGRIVRLDPDAFVRFEREGDAKAVWSFRVVPSGSGSRVLTETRVKVYGVRARRARRLFRLYWLVVKPFSALIRRRVLASIREAAERRG